MKTPYAIIIMDGYGINKDTDGNAVYLDGSKNIAAVESLVFGDEKRKAAFVARKGAFDEAELLRRAVFSAARHVKGALVAEGIEKGQQALFFPVGNLEKFCDFGKGLSRQGFVFEVLK